MLCYGPVDTCTAVARSLLSIGWQLVWLIGPSMCPAENFVAILCNDGGKRFLKLCSIELLFCSCLSGWIIDDKFLVFSSFFVHVFNWTVCWLGLARGGVTSIL